jgi:hypothetical protein
MKEQMPPDIQLASVIFAAAATAALAAVDRRPL